MINRHKLSKKLSTQCIEVDIQPYNFEFYKCKLEVNTDCFYITKEVFINKKWYYKWIVKQINNLKKDFHKHWENGNEKWFNEFYAD